jgi:putative toxin-antitoxin system antitoxin component (TIGR02293 family)
LCHVAAADAVLTGVLAMTEALKEAAAILGLKKVSTTLDFLPYIRRGLPTKTVDSVAKRLDLSSLATVESLGFAKRTWARRVQSGELLSPEESERVVGLARVLAVATQVLGDSTTARRWLLTENRALGGIVPLRMLDTGIGASAVLDELGRIEHGVYA